LLGMALQGLAGSYFFVPVPTAAQTEAGAARAILVRNFRKELVL